MEPAAVYRAILGLEALEEVVAEGEEVVVGIMGEVEALQVVHRQVLVDG